MKTPKMPIIDPWLRKQDTPVTSGKLAHEGHNVPAIVSKYGNIRRQMSRSLLFINRPIGCIIEAKKSARSIQNNPLKEKKFIPYSTLKELEIYANKIGVNQIGYTRVNKDYIFRDHKILYENAIVFTLEMKKDKINHSPSLVANKEIFRTYHELGIIVNKIADFLRNHGFNAQAGPALGGDVNYVMLARDAGLGELGKHGLLITEEYGPSLRIAAVYTDIENLPFSETNPHSWIRDFCNKCNSCVRSCPAKAIYPNPKVFEDGTEEHIDYKKCAVPFSNDYGCTLCVKNCTFYKQNYYTIKAKFYSTCN